MGNLMDDSYLGNLVDLIDSEEDQSILNIDLLYDHDRVQLINSCKYRINTSYLNFLIESCDLNDIEYWKIVLSEYINEYNLNPAKLYIDNNIDNKNLTSQIIEFIIYLKIRFVSLIEKRKIDKNITRDNLENYLRITEAPDIFIYSIQYIDKDSYKKFIKRIFDEINYSFME